jgi:hypothetical protein
MKLNFFEILFFKVALQKKKKKKGVNNTAQNLFRKIVQFSEPQIKYPILFKKL